MQKRGGKKERYYYKCQQIQSHVSDPLRLQVFFTSGNHLHKKNLNHNFGKNIDLYLAKRVGCNVLQGRSPHANDFLTVLEQAGLHKSHIRMLDVILIN